MSVRLRWGIMGAGIIARRMAEAIAVHIDSELLWVSSKDRHRAASLAAELHVPAWGTYEEMLSDDAVDIVYVATTHNFHHSNALAALEHGKHVVVEKPFTVNAVEATQVIELAKQNGLFLMEGMWTRFLPSYHQMRRVIREGCIGDVRYLTIPFGKYADPRYLRRLTEPDLAGGATLDMGIYAISFCCFMLGSRPSTWDSVCRFSPEGVDEQAAYQFVFPSGEIAQVCTSYAVNMERRAALYGTHGYIIFPDFPFGSRFHTCRHNGTNDCIEELTSEADHGSNGFIYELDEVARCVEQGLKESPLIPWEETREIMQLIDSMRAKWGLLYPFEKEGIAD